MFRSVNYSDDPFPLQLCPCMLNKSVIVLGARNLPSSESEVVTSGRQTTCSLVLLGRKF